MLSSLTDLDWSRVWSGIKTNILVVVAIGELLLLCACAQERPTGDTLGDTPSPIRTAAPVVTASPNPSLPNDRPPATAPPDSSTAMVDLAIQLPESVQITPGESAIYTLTIRNHGPAVATNLVLTDLLPTGVIPVWTQATQPECGRQENRAGCDVGYFQGGDTVTVTLDLSIGGTETLITGTQLAGLDLDLSVPSCNLDQATNPAQLTCRMSRLEPGREIAIPIGVELLTSFSEPLLHTITVSVDETDEHPEDNQATFAMVLDTDQTTRAFPAETPTVAEVDLVLHASAPSNVFAGRPFTYAYTITNQGTLAATGVNFESTLPPATELVAYSPGRPLCESNGSTFTCTLRDPYSGETITFTLQTTGHDQQPVVVELDPLMPGWPVCTVLKERSFLHILICELGELKPEQSIQLDMAITAEGVRERSIDNPASVQSYEPDLNSGNNAITTTTAVRVSADLSLVAEIEGPAAPGEAFSYILTATNLGPSDAAAVLLDHHLPAGTNLLSAVPGEGWECEISDDSISCEAGRLAAGETGAVTITLEVDSPLIPAESVTFTAQVESEQSDPDWDNNLWTEFILLEVGSDD